MVVNTRCMDIAPHLLADGLWEPETTETFRRLLRPGLNVVDIGAFDGYYSVLAAASVGPSGRVWSFEPNLDAVEIVATNLMINGFSDRTTIINKAVSSSSGRTAFGRFYGRLGGSTLWPWVYPDRSAYEVIDVEVATLDEYFPPGARVDVIKMDAQGAEPLILASAGRVLEENPGIQVIAEFWRDGQEVAVAPRDLAEVWEELVTRHRFTVHQIESDGSVTPVAVSDLIAMPVCDVLLRR